MRGADWCFHRRAVWGGFMNLPPHESLSFFWEMMLFALTKKRSFGSLWCLWSLQLFILMETQDGLEQRGSQLPLSGFLPLQPNVWWPVIRMDSAAAWGWRMNLMDTHMGSKLIEKKNIKGINRNRVWLMGQLRGKTVQNGQNDRRQNVCGSLDSPCFSCVLTTFLHMNLSTRRQRLQLDLTLQFVKRATPPTGRGSEHFELELMSRRWRLKHSAQWLMFLPF